MENKPRITLNDESEKDKYNRIVQDRFITDVQSAQYAMTYNDANVVSRLILEFLIDDNNENNKNNFNDMNYNYIKKYISIVDVNSNIGSNTISFMYFFRNVFSLVDNMDATAFYIIHNNIVNYANVYNNIEIYKKSNSVYIGELSEIEQHITESDKSGLEGTKFHQVFVNSNEPLSDLVNYKQNVFLNGYNRRVMVHDTFFKSHNLYTSTIAFINFFGKSNIDISLIKKMLSKFNLIFCVFPPNFDVNNLKQQIPLCESIIVYDKNSSARYDAEAMNKRLQISYDLSPFDGYDETKYRFKGNFILVQIKKNDRLLIG